MILLLMRFCSGADLRGLCERAGMAAAERDFDATYVTMADFEAALSQVHPSASPTSPELQKMQAWARKRQANLERARDDNASDDVKQ